MNASISGNFGMPLGAGELHQALGFPRISGHMQLLNMGLESSLKKEEYTSVSDRIGIKP